MLKKSDAVLAILKNNPSLKDQPASRIVTEVKRQYRLDISPSYVSMLMKKEYLDMSKNNGTMTATQPPTQPEPQKPPETPPIPQIPQIPPTIPTPAMSAATVIDFKAVDSMMDVLCEVSDLAQKCGGLENLIVIAQKMSQKGIRPGHICAK